MKISGMQNQSVGYVC